MSTGIMLGIIAWLSVLFMWKSLPHSVKLWSLRHHIITDLMTGVVVYYSMSMFSKSIVCMVATVTAPFLMNLTMMALSHEKGRAYFNLQEPEHVPLTQRIKGWFPRRSK